MNIDMLKVVPCRYIWFSREWGGEKLSTEMSRLRLLLHKGVSSTPRHEW